MRLKCGYAAETVQIWLFLDFNTHINQQLADIINTVRIPTFGTTYMLFKTVSGTY
jgi:hypothetical protein